MENHKIQCVTQDGWRLLISGHAPVGLYLSMDDRGNALTLARATDGAEVETFTKMADAVIHLIKQGGHFGVGVLVSLMDMQVGSQIDWKPGLITYYVYRIAANGYQLDTTSDGWYTTYINRQALFELITGNRSFLALEWE